MRALVALAGVAVGCGPVPPASDRVPVSGGVSTTGADEATRPGSDAPVNGETADDDEKFDVVDGGETGSTCPRTAELVALPSAVEVLVDVSQTMATHTVDHDGDVRTPEITRWAMLAGALAEFLPALAEHADIDVQIFPRADAAAPPASEACEFTAGPGLGSSAEALLASLPPAEATSMQGANPAASAFERAYQRLARVADDRTRTIVLITDSAPNCGEDMASPALFDAADDAVHGWAEYAWLMDVRTHVVGVAVPAGEFGGSEGQPLANHIEELARIATAGGTGFSFSTSTYAFALAADLADIVTQARPCRAHIPEELASGWLSVEIVDSSFYEIGPASCPSSDGFAFVDNGRHDTIELCGHACSLFLEAGAAMLVEDCAIQE